jgi:hypothetical protein
LNPPGWLGAVSSLIRFNEHLQCGFLWGLKRRREWLSDAPVHLAALADSRIQRDGKQPPGKTLAVSFVLVYLVQGYIFESLDSRVLGLTLQQSEFFLQSPGNRPAISADQLGIGGFFSRSQAPDQLF